MKISVLGSGGWGTALAILSYKCGNESVLWGKFPEEIDDLKKTRENPLLKGITIPDEVKLSSDLDDIKDCDIVIIATPSFAVKDTAMLINGVVSTDAIVVSVAKGFEKDTLERFSVVIGEQMPNNRVVVLSGPSHAEEVAMDIPTSIVAAGIDEQACKCVQQTFTNDFFRVYTNSDVIGVETGAALKNVVAVAAGIIDGLGLGDNTIAALITRGIVEMSTLGEKMGGNRATFSGLSGLGDLIVTCTSVHSRNRRFGKLLGQGVPVDEALKQVGMTVEGYFAVLGAKKLALEYGVEMPIVEECYKVMYQGQSPKVSMKNLMNRSLKAEN